MPLFHRERKETPTKETPTLESPREFAQAYHSRPVASPDALARLIDPALDAVFGIDFDGLPQKLRDAGVLRADSVAIQQEWDTVTDEWIESYNETLQRVFNPLCAVSTTDDDPLMPIHMVTEALLTHYLRFLKEDARAYNALMRSNNRKLLQKHEQEAEEAKQWMEIVKTRLAGELRKLREHRPDLFDLLAISENNLYDLGAKDLLPMDSGLAGR